MPGPKTDTRSYSGLGTWVDVFDGSLNPEESVAAMASRGVQTLFLETGRFDRPDDRAKDFEQPERVERWLLAAHSRGIRVVGWYLPAYEDMERDVRRTVAIARFRARDGNGFDGLAIDVEYKARAPDLPTWNRWVVEHARRVRELVGAFPIGVIVPAPLGMALRPQSWEGFPWRELAGVADVFLPMSYWSYRDDCPEVPEHCPYGYTKGNVEEVRRLTGRPGVPVHPVGGVASQVSEDEVREYVRAVLEVGGYGGSLYDFATTADAFWAHLGRLRR